MHVLHIVEGFGTVLPSGISFFVCVTVPAAEATLSDKPVPRPRSRCSVPHLGPTSAGVQFSLG